MEKASLDDSASWLSKLSTRTQECIARLQAAPKAPSFSHVPKRKQAAVAAILYESSSGQLMVIMSTRALHLRSHPGQASLPGGKMDSTDRDVAHTALRESVEEIDLPAKRTIWLHTGFPFLSKLGLLVHPVVFFLRDGEKQITKLVASPSEVSDIWSYPLAAFLSSVAATDLMLADPTSVDKHRPPQTAYRTYTDVPWLGSHYRLHRFRSHKQLIKGLTADVLISVATDAYGQKPLYQVTAPGQKTWVEMVNVMVKRYIHPNQRPEQRWGDGESGDAQGSSESFETHEGIDLDHDIGQENGL